MQNTKASGDFAVHIGALNLHNTGSTVVLHLTKVMDTFKQRLSGRLLRTADCSEVFLFSSEAFCFQGIQVLKSFGTQKCRNALTIPVTWRHAMASWHASNFASAVPRIEATRIISLSFGRAYPRPGMEDVSISQEGVTYMCNMCTCIA